jgi:lycopene cyclase domain-containing protein
MTYFAFLLRFLVMPLVFMLILTLIDERRARPTRGFLNGKAVWLAIGLHVLVAVLYTTPWDNYLVATGVWFYDPQLISGVFLGYVPLEEYLFFVLETTLTGLWWWFLARRVATSAAFTPSGKARVLSTAMLGIIWLFSPLVLLSNWQPGTYLALILFWALPAIMLQTAFGADILWHHRKLLTSTILPIVLYLSFMDSFAIASGTWTIDPAQSLQVFIGNLPIEEAVFFLVTVVLVSFGITLLLAQLSHGRWEALRNRIRNISPKK